MYVVLEFPYLAHIEVEDKVKGGKYERYTLRLTKDMDVYIKSLSEYRGISPTTLIKNILGEYREAHEHGKR